MAHEGLGVRLTPDGVRDVVEAVGETVEVTLGRQRREAVADLPAHELVLVQQEVPAQVKLRKRHGVEQLPVTEDAPLQPQNVYGRTKRIVEDFLRDLARANANWRIAVLRYFNPAGAHASAMLGESPRGKPQNLVPLLCRIAADTRQ